MSELLKTEAVVLRKLDYGDTSKIATLYSDELGKFAVIIKGGRTAKTKVGMIVDPLNIIQIVLYKKDTREIQIVTQADLVFSPNVLKDDLERIKYASAIAELVFNLIPEHEANLKIFRGIKKILMLLNDKNENPKILFIKFFLFFVKEIGYEIQLSSCASCGKELSKDMALFYSYNKGALCPECQGNYAVTADLSQELFQTLICLNGKQNRNFGDMKILDKAIYFLEKYLSYHIEEFKGIKSLHIY